MISVLSLALALGLSPTSAADDDPAALVAKLGSPQAADRDKAVTALETLGRRALPALRAVKDSQDTEVRNRAMSLLDKIETSLLIQPTLVTLDYQEQPVATVVKAIAAQSGFALGLEPPNDPSWQTQRITLREAQPVAFWESLERLGQVALIRQHPGFPRALHDTAPVLHLATGSGDFPKVVSGPFRINLLSVHRRHDLAFAPKDDEQAEREEDPEPNPETFEVIMQVFAEPHLRITLNGAPKQLKARDDFDQDLVLPPPPPDDDMDGAPAEAPQSYFERGPGFLPGLLSIVQFPLALRAPERPGTTIERLEGFIPLQVALRRPDPTTITLIEAPGQTFQCEDVTLRFEPGKLDLEKRGPFEVYVRKQEKPDALTPDPEPAPLNFPEPRPVDTFQNRVEILDSTGKPLGWSVQETETLEDGEVRVVLALALRNGKAVPAKLRYYGLVRSAIEVPFKFTKVPMP